MTERCTTDGRPAENAADAPVPTDRKLADGQNAAHWVLCEAERAKGYVRPVRDDYIHEGIAGPKFAVVDLSDEQKARTEGSGWVKFEPYPEGYKGKSLGKYWTQEQLDSIGRGCKTVTKMPRACAETYARQPGYYGKTFCCGCGTYLPVGAAGEFIWNDGSNERVGT